MQHNQCKVCQRKIVEGAVICVFCRLDQMHGPWNGKVSPVPKMRNTTVQHDSATRQ